MSSSPWSRAGSPSGTLSSPPAPPPTPPSTASHTATPFLTGSPRDARAHHRVWPWVTLGLLLAVVISAATGAMVTFAAIRNGIALPAQPSTAEPAPTSTAQQFSSADMAAAKQNLCHVFDVSSGQNGQGGFRVEGHLNMPVTLQAVTSAVAVENALTPVVPADVASAARRYVTTTLDVATAAMGNTSINEINRLTTVSNGAVDALLSACGLPR
ncbi:hypothetical protein MMARE11_p00550 (plasmid) [Mycobacterium marinum E11]|nr:hypothetical protein MMARE11_p00550 [Mycobacterium marinum E11]